ncbi:uncharacterized protein C8orf48-like [Trichomycterus rosablanca]|uniref:uncharacterized protein C8orf48-like n=1 Tax=Trichomycterus rosablanca TaxID=2290929 RepID=UPI002F35C11E
MMNCKKVHHMKQAGVCNYGTIQNKCELKKPVGDWCVPENIIWNIKMKTFREKLKQAANQDFHDPSRCRACTEKQADLALDSFIRKKTTQLQNRLLEEKIQTHLQNHESVQLIAETLRDLPKPSDNHQEIWNKLQLKSQNSHTNK